MALSIAISSPPSLKKPAAAIVLASAIHGVDDDMIAIADELAAYGFIVAVPDLFWRSIAGPHPKLTATVVSARPGSAQRGVNARRCLSRARWWANSR